MIRLVGKFSLIAVIVTAAGLSRPLAAQTQQPCGTTTLCLGGGRFQFLASWSNPDTQDQKAAQPVPLTSDSGYFWFFDPANIEITVKVLDGCSENGNEWVFVAGMTNLTVTISVTDIQSGSQKTYTNSQGTAFQPVQDTSTFPICPGGSAGAIAGSWTGTFDSADFIDCDSNTPAQASFEQVGSAVTGTLSAPTNFCGPDNAAFSGTLQGATLTGTVTGHGVGGGLYTNATAFGSLSGTNLTLQIVNGSGLIPGGTLNLHR